MGLPLRCLGEGVLLLADTAGDADVAVAVAVAVASECSRAPVVVRLTGVEEKAGLVAASSGGLSREEAAEERLWPLGLVMRARGASCTPPPPPSGALLWMTPLGGGERGRPSSVPARKRLAWWWWA